MVNRRNRHLRRILLVRNDRIGDLVLTLPAFEAVRRHWPQAHVTALVSPEAGPLVAGNRTINELVVDDPADSPWQLGRRLKSMRFDAALVFNTNTRNCLAVWLSGIRARSGSGRGRGRVLPLRHRRDAARNPPYKAVPLMNSINGPLRVGVGGPVGTGKTALMDALCKTFRDRYDIAAITNDIYTKEDAEFLTRAGSLTPDRILGIETGGCPHTAIREDASINLAGVAELRKRFPALDVILIESGGDNLAATFSPELADLTIYVIDVSAGDKIPRKGGPGITRSDLLVINKIDLAPHVGASLEVMDRDSRKMRGERPFVFANIRAGQGVAEVASFIERRGGLDA